MGRISELEKEYEQTVISFEMEIFQGYTCIGCAVVNDFEVESGFSLKELSRMRYLVFQLDEEQVVVAFVGKEQGFLGELS